MDRLVRTWWTERIIDAPSAVVWELLTNVERWPDWGPSVRAAVLDGTRFEAGATGSVGTVVGVRLSFEITTYDEGRRWSWKVAGIPATDHRVTPLGAGRCRVGIGVPALAAPYLAVCRIGLRRLSELATSRQSPDE